MGPSCQRTPIPTASSRVVLPNAKDSSRSLMAPMPICVVQAEMVAVPWLDGSSVATKGMPQREPSPSAWMLFMYAASCAGVMLLESRMSA